MYVFRCLCIYVLMYYVFIYVCIRSLVMYYMRYLFR